MKWAMERIEKVTPDQTVLWKDIKQVKTIKKNKHV